MSDRIDIHVPLAEVCARLGLEPENVRTLTVTACNPAQAVATVYRLRDGKSYVNAETGWPAVETRIYEVTT